MSKEIDNLGIRELQIRLNGYNETDCQKRQKIAGKKRYMTMRCISRLKQELADIPVKNLRIVSDNADSEKMLYLLREFPFQKAIVSTANDLVPSLMIQLKQICHSKNKDLVILKNCIREQDIAELHVSAYDFSYRRHFNPCLGHQVAIDCNGEIKPCLWWKESLGTIGQDSLKNLIVSGIFDKYWEHKKDRITVCKNCERRFACNDCRVSIIGDERDDGCNGKPAYCNYDPYNP